MDESLKSYSQAAKQLGVAMSQNCFNDSEVKLAKHQVNDSYNSWAHLVYDKAFLNWGLWDKRIVDEYQGLNFDFSRICNVQDIHSQCLLYYLIRPLIKNRFFYRRLLDIGCGNGIGLKASSELLKTEYALGIDLVNKLVTHATRNFHKGNKINYIQSDAEHLPLASDSFDIITNLESSHLYPQIEHFFEEVARVLAPGGFFCYADIYFKSHQQPEKLDAFINARNNLKIIQKIDITSMVQASIYRRLIVNEDLFYKQARAMFAHKTENLFIDLSALASARGLTFLPWWKIWFKTPALRKIAKNARKDTFWGTKCFFYYLIQKVRP